MKDKTLDSIKEYIEDGEMSFLIGAGFSRNVSDVYPMWDGLLKDAIWKLFGDGNRAKLEKKVIEKTVKEYGYLGIASQFVKKAGYHEAIDTYIECKTPYIRMVDKRPVLFLNGKQLHNDVNSECHLLLKNLDIQNIYTFNYDNALEFFLGEDARMALEEKIEVTVQKIRELHKIINELEKQENTLKERLADLSLEERDSNCGDAIINTDRELSEVTNTKKELRDIQISKQKRIIEKNELYSTLDTDKSNLNSYYNVVKDSYEISLSAKRKSIYKIHGSLRESAESEYGFDGDKHAHYIITQEDYDTYNEKHGAFVNMMRIDLLRNRFCIMGVSGGDANFLAWIDWVKDVLDKTKDRAMQEKEKKHQSFFVYSSSTDMPEELALMLRNHFIEPVILKDIFPASRNDEERIKLFLEYLQPFKNNDAARFSSLWDGIVVPRSISNNINSISESVAEELFQMSFLNKYHSPHSKVHYMSIDAQKVGRYYLRDGATRSDRLIYAAAIQSSLMPIDLLCSNEDYNQMDKESDKTIRDVFENSCRRVVLLRHLSGKNKKYLEGDPYIRMLYNLHEFRFPTPNEVASIGCNSGIDFVRKYSLMQLINGFTDAPSCSPDAFNSPQELVLVADWLKYIGYKNPSMYNKAEEYKKAMSLLSLYDYYKAYLYAMRRNKNPETYGNVSNTIYLDRFPQDKTNAAVLLNSFVELGICFSGHNLMDDSDWLEIVRALKQYYPVALAFYSIARNGSDKSIKIVAQELMYDDNSRKVLPSVLKNIVVSLVSDSTPLYLKAKMALMASEILPAIDSKYWSRLFVAKAESILDVADNSNYNTLSESSYEFVAKALGYIRAKPLRLRLLRRVLEKMNPEDSFGSHYNSLAIAARDRLKPSEFAPLYDLFISFAEKTIKGNSQQAYFVIMNLMVLMRGEEKHKVLELIKEKSLKDSYLIGGYAFRIKDYPDLVKSFVDGYLNQDDLWYSGVNDSGFFVEGTTVRVCKIDEAVKFNEEQVGMIYRNLKDLLGRIREKVLGTNQSGVDEWWMSPENTFREVLIDMRLFVNRHPKQLLHCEDYEETVKNLIEAYKRCFEDKDLFELIADDEMHKAIRMIMTEVEIFGIDKYRLEYEQLIGRIIARDSTELNSLFRHISWAMNYYKSFFSSGNFKNLFSAILNVYKPYFDTNNRGSRPWNLIGCQKEVAEKALVSISKTMEKWGEKDDFWCNYQRVFYL